MTEPPSTSRPMPAPADLAAAAVRQGARGIARSSWPDSRRAACRWRSRSRCTNVGWRSTTHCARAARFRGAAGAAPGRRQRRRLHGVMDLRPDDESTADGLTGRPHAQTAASATVTILPASGSPGHAGMRHDSSRTVYEICARPSSTRWPRPAATWELAGRGGADRGAASRPGQPDRPHRLGHRSPGLRAQAAHRPPRTFRHAAPTGRHRRLPASHRERARRHGWRPRRHRHLHRRGPRAGARCPRPGTSRSRWWWATRRS